MLEKIWLMLEKLNNDVDFYYDYEDDCVSITIKDIYGVDDNWKPVFRDYSNPELVEKFEQFLEKECINKYGDFNTYYVFKDFIIVLDYKSNNID